MARPRFWNRHWSILTLSGLADAQSEDIGIDFLSEGSTVVRSLGRVDVRLEPNEFSGFTQLWCGIYLGSEDSLNPQTPNAIIEPGWLWWDYLVVENDITLGEPTDAYRWSPSHTSVQFDVHGARVAHPVTGPDSWKFYATSSSTGDAPAAIRVHYSVSSLFLDPTP